MNTKKKTEKERKTVNVLNQGFKWNPAINLPRNEKCLCGSGKKYKKCCLDKIPRAIPTDEEMAKKIRAAQALEKLKEEFKQKGVLDE